MKSLNFRNHLLQLGFTLIEVMIAVVIVAILAAIAYPSYTKYILDSRMQAGMRILENVNIAQERYYLVKRSFADNLPELGIIDVPANVQKDFQPIQIVFTTPSMSISATTSPSLDPTIANVKSDWVAVLTPRTDGRLANQFRLAVNANGEKWMEVNQACNSSWSNHCCRYGSTSSGVCATPSEASTNTCRNFDWKEWLEHKPYRKTIGCP